MEIQKKKGKLKGKARHMDIDKDMAAILADSRFAHISTDPQFRNAPVARRKVKLDERFDSVLKNELFTEKASMDPRGRPRNFGTRENFNRFYHADSSEEEDSESAVLCTSRKMDCEKKLKKASKIGKNSKIATSIELKKPKKKEKVESENISTKEQDESEQLKRDAIPRELLDRLLDMTHDVARGDTLFSDDSSDDDSSSTDEDDVEASGEFEWGELDHDALWDCDTDVEETSRFAVCNMDWDQVKAIDLIVLFSSFVPPGGKINKVSLYLSEFGKKRLEQEEVRGPQELVQLSNGNQENDSELKYLEKVSKGTLDEGSGPTPYQVEALRRYQRNRLKYYYAVVECDSVQTAKVIYKECDRMPYEVVGVTLDLRYIPSDMDFDTEIVHDSCEYLPDSYESESFKTTALLDSKPSLTWDETDRVRRKTLNTAVTKALQKETYDAETLKNYVADSSSDEEGDLHDIQVSDEETSSNKMSKAERIARFRVLMEYLENRENKKDNLEIDKEETFIVRGDDGDSQEMKCKAVQAEEDDEEKKAVTPFEKYLMKRNEKRKEKPKKKKIVSAEDSSESDHKDFGLSDDELPEDAQDLASDPFFASATFRTKKNKSAPHQNYPYEEPEAALDLMLMEEEQDEGRHFNMRTILEADKQTEKKNRKKRKTKKDKAVTKAQRNTDFTINIDDPRFAAITTSSDFSLDPSHPQYVPTKAMNSLAEQVQKKRKTVLSAEKMQNRGSKLHDDISALVKRVKLKTSLKEPH